ncbi:MAG: molybdopterin dinucleotide binding domain-containing protein, partial [Pseudomonadota bacterium]
MLPITAPTQTATAGFRLNTGRIRDQWHTMTRTGKSPRLGQHMGEPYAEIHPDDAADLGLGVADLIEITAGSHKTRLRALPTDKVARGALFAPMHWTRQRLATDPVNAVIQTGTDPVSGQPALKAGHVTARKFDARWYGFVAAARTMSPVSDYCAIARTATGWQAELAGAIALDDAAALLERLVGPLRGDVSDMQDTRAGLRRIAHRVDGILEAVFYIGPDPVVVSREHAVALIGTDANTTAALSARRAGNVQDPGATVCACMGVGINDLHRALANGATTVEALGAATGAGTNCGACRPELASLLPDPLRTLAAE